MAAVAQRHEVYSSDPTAQYLNAMGTYELLTAEEEIELAKAIEAGRTAAGTLETSRPRGREAAALRQLVTAGERARDRFVNANLRLVVSQARRYRNAGGLDFIDLIQEGNLGLMRAVDKFDWRKGFKFSTYATWWIRQSIQRALAEKSRTVRIPSTLHDTAATVHAVASRLEAETGRTPTVAELAEEAGVSPEDVDDVLRMNDTVSLEAPVGEDGAVLGDFVEDADEIDPVGVATAAAVGSELRRAIDRLPERDRRILTLRYGFVDGIPKTHEEIGWEFDLTRERIRQLEKAALCKLRHPSFGLREEDLW